MSTGRCSVCRVNLTEENCRPSIYKRGSGYCNNCINKWTKEWYKNHQEYAGEKRRRYWTLERRLAKRREAKESKMQVIAHYSNGTMSCGNPYGEHNLPYLKTLALTVDHIGGGGSRHRRKLRYWSIYKWLVVEGFPSGYQILCMNCQMIKKTVENEYHSELIEKEYSSPIGINQKLLASGGTKQPV